MPLAEALLRVQELLSIETDPIFNSQRLIETFPLELIGLLQIVTAATNLIQNDISIYYASKSSAQPSISKETLKLLVSSVDFLADCISLFSHAPADQHSKSPCDDAKGSKMSDAAFAAFLDAWDLLSFPSVDSLADRGVPPAGDLTSRFITTMARAGPTGLSLFVESFCRAVDALIDESIMAISECKSFQPSPRECIIKAGKFWAALASVSSLLELEDDAYIMPPRSYIAYLKSAGIKEAMLEANDRLNVYISNPSYLEAANLKGDKVLSLFEDLELRAALLAAQTACYAIYRVDLASEKREPDAFEVAQSLGPAVTSIAALLQGIEASLKKGKSPQTTSISWDILRESFLVCVNDTLCWINHQMREETIDGSLASLGIADVKDGNVGNLSALRPSNSAEEITTILELVTTLLGLEVTLCGLLADHPKLWESADSSDGGEFEGPIPGLALLLVFVLLEPMDFAFLRKVCLNAKSSALGVMDAAIKCKFAFSALPASAIKIIQKLHSEFDPLVEELDAWNACSQGILAIAFLSMTLSFDLDSPEELVSDEKEFLSCAAAALAMLKALSKEHNAVLSTSAVMQELIPLVLTVLLVSCKDVPVMLPSDLEGLKVLEALIERNSTTASAVASIDSPLDNFAQGLSLLLEPSYVSTEDNGSPDGQGLSSEELLEMVNDLIILAGSEEDLLERGIRRAQALAMRPCCNLECISVNISGEQVPKMRCAGCEKQHYCSERCQKECWNEHKLVCENLKAMKSHGI